MKKYEKEVQKAFLDDEEAVIRKLTNQYSHALKEINSKSKALQEQIKSLQGTLDAVTDEAARAQLQSMIQSKVYQKQYQDALKKQISAILDNLQVEEFKTLSEYLTKCYEEGFVGSMYSLHQQGIPLIIPLDQAAMVKAVQLDSKISNGLYTRLGEDVALLKKKITAQISRGISTGMSYAQTAEQLSRISNIGFNNAVRIARTDGHRIQVQSGMDACYKARDKGADVVKQWDAALDGRTRPSHQKVDGEIRELDEPFSNGLMFPGDPSGGAGEVVNCRCALLQRAKWALDEDELKTLKERAEYFGLDKTPNFDDFKKKYLNLPENADTMTVDKSVIETPEKSNDANYNRLLAGLRAFDVEYNPVISHASQQTESEIIAALSGGDMTRGSCASVGLAYIGQKQGWNVLDFRDGESRRMFSESPFLLTLSQMDGMKALRAQGASSMTVGNRLLKMCEPGKEYYLAVGRHAAIVRKNDDGVLQYLELQSKNRSGWTDFDGNPRYTLKTRFGCTQTSGSAATYDFMLDLTESDFTSTDDFRTLLGFINTEETAQRKGQNGTIK